MKRKLAALITGLAKDSGPAWQPVGQPYPRLLEFDPTAAGLVGAPGVAVIWHLGVRPQWLRVVATRDLAASLAALMARPELLKFQPNGGIYLAWRYEPGPAAVGVRAFLDATLRPAFSAPVLPGEWPAGKHEKIFCPLPPGTEQPQAD